MKYFMLAAIDAELLTKIQDKGGSCKTLRLAVKRMGTSEYIP